MLNVVEPRRFLYYCTKEKMKILLDSGIAWISCVIQLNPFPRLLFTVLCSFCGRRPCFRTHRHSCSHFPKSRADTEFGFFFLGILIPKSSRQLFSIQNDPHEINLLFLTSPVFYHTSLIHPTVKGKRSLKNYFKLYIKFFYHFKNSKGT